MTIEWFKNENNFNTWIWDNEFKTWVHFIKYSEGIYMQIRCVTYLKDGLGVATKDICYIDGTNTKLPEFEFRENRFYKKEVKDDENEQTNI